jgi:hypothetical protein
VRIENPLLLSARRWGDPLARWPERRAYLRWRAKLRHAGLWWVAAGLSISSGDISPPSWTRSSELHARRCAEARGADRLPLATRVRARRAAQRGSTKVISGEGRSGTPSSARFRPRTPPTARSLQRCPLLCPESPFSTEDRRAVLVLRKGTGRGCGSRRAAMTGPFAHRGVRALSRSNEVAAAIRRSRRSSNRPRLVQGAGAPFLRASSTEAKRAASPGESRAGQTTAVSGAARHPDPSRRHAVAGGRTVPSSSRQAARRIAAVVRGARGARSERPMPETAWLLVAEPNVAQITRSCTPKHRACGSRSETTGA